MSYSKKNSKLENAVAELILQRLKHEDPIVENMADLCGEYSVISHLKSIANISMRKPYRAVAYLPYLGNLRFYAYDLSQPNGIIPVRFIYEIDRLKLKSNTVLNFSIKPTNDIIEEGIEGDLRLYITSLN